MDRAVLSVGHVDLGVNSGDFCGCHEDLGVDYVFCVVDRVHLDTDSLHPDIDQDCSDRERFGVDFCFAHLEDFRLDMGYRPRDFVHLVDYYMDRGNLQVDHGEFG